MVKFFSSKFTLMWLDHYFTLLEKLKKKNNLAEIKYYISYCIFIINKNITILYFI